RLNQPSYRRFKMFTNRNKLSALLLSTLLSISALQPARAANFTEADAKACEWLDQQLRMTDGGSPASAFCNGPASVYQGNSMTVSSATEKTDNSPDTWYERQLRIQHG
ncbi:MAG TPA: hypothetical protein VLL03_05395, partial [Burkholderiales bacterium]|nr:hypothetical protein [Burkholderiales bacterium]